MNPGPDIFDHPARDPDCGRRTPQPAAAARSCSAPEGFHLRDAASGEEALAMVQDAAARSDPAGHHDAGDGRLRGGGPHQGRPRHQEHSRHHDHRARRSRRPDARAERRRRGLSHEAGGSGRAVRAGEEPAAPQGVRRLPRSIQPDAGRGSRLAHGRPGGQRAALPVHVRRRAGRDRARRSRRAMAARQSAPVRSPGLLARGAAERGGPATGRAGRWR